MEPKETSSAEPRYSLFVGLIFTFNLIVGTGALAIPRAFSDAGYALGISILLILAFASYVSTTFVVESMAIGNALLRWKSGQKPTRSRPTSRSELWDTGIEDEEDDSTISKFEIKSRLEVGQLAGLFLNKGGVFFFYLCLIVYLFGDLAIYATVVPKSLVQVICTYIPPEELNLTCFSNFSVSDLEPCWSHVSLTRMQVYRIGVLVFGLLMGPFVFFNVTKTKYLQIFTSMSRWSAIILMVVLSSIFLVKHPQEVKSPRIANGKSFAPLFGVCVYAFMCQHSLPALITPIRTKGRLHLWMGLVVISVFCVYSVLALTAVFTFSDIYDVYTLNFRSACQSDSMAVTNVQFFEYFLALYPVFTLSTNFPIIGVTLRNNLRKMFVPSAPAIWPKRSTPSGFLNRVRNLWRSAPVETHSPTHERLLPDDGIAVDPAMADEPHEITEAILLTRMSGNSLSTTMWAVERLLIPVMVVILPITVALITNDVEFLVSFTGSYAGVGVQYIMPAILVLAARKFNRKHLSEAGKNGYSSPFRHNVCVYVLIAWAGATVIIVTLNHIFASNK